MRNRACMHLCAVIVVILIIWKLASDQFDTHETTRNVFAKSVVKCDLSESCSPDHFALRIRSGAANIIGPTICVDGKIIMSHVLNNVGSGLNIVQVNGENGTVERFDFLNMKIGIQKDILAYLKAIKPGTIVLVASFNDITLKMTDEMREIFVGLGSTMIKSVQFRDNWVFAGRAGTELKSAFEKQAVNNKTTNLYDDWPEMVEPCDRLAICPGTNRVMTLHAEFGH
ncbi:hypothetical protein LDENG_00223590 [Lucifuga dentata]|nr:hypothetical protein LDENG_00223590 [Lucifuga dentata]